jgi:hypothetical protein
VAAKRAPATPIDVVVTHSPPDVCVVWEPLPVKMPSTTMIGMIRISRNAVVTRLSCSGYWISSRAG